MAVKKAGKNWRFVLEKTIKMLFPRLQIKSSKFLAVVTIWAPEKGSNWNYQTLILKDFKDCSSNYSGRESSVFSIIQMCYEWNANNLKASMFPSWICCCHIGVTLLIINEMSPQVHVTSCTHTQVTAGGQLQDACPDTCVLKLMDEQADF